MALLKFFKIKKMDKELVKEKQNNLTEVLPDPTGPLSIVVPTSSISDANQEVSMIYKEIVSCEWRKGPYVKLTDLYQ